MIKLLIVSTIPLTIKSFLLPFAEHFRKSDYKVDALCRKTPLYPDLSIFFDETRETNWSRNPLDLTNLINCPKEVKNLILEKEYDIVHVHTPIAALVTRYALRDIKDSVNCKIIYTAHGFHFDSSENNLKNWLFLLAEKLAGNWTDYLVVINKEDEVAAKKYRLLPPERIVYMPGIGVDLDYYRAPNLSIDGRLEFLRTLGLSDNDHLLLMIAEFIPRKRHKDILLALSKLNRPNVHIAFAGDGPLFEQIKQFSDSLGIRKNVHFLGYRNDIPTLILAATATVLISQQEGLPRSVMESMALETPVIGTNIRGTRDLLDDQRGLLVKVGDIDGIVKAINWLITHPLEVQEMVARSKSHIVNYDLKNVIRLHEDLYEKALGDG